MSLRTLHARLLLTLAFAFCLVLPLSAAPADNISLPLSKAERLWLKEHPVIRLGVDRAFPPFGSIKDDTYIGFAADYMTLIAERLGITFDIQKDVPWAETLEMAQRQEIDMIAGMVRTEAREAYLNFTPSYVSTASIIINDGHKNGYVGDLSMLRGKVVALEKGSFSSDMLTQHYPEIKLIEVQNTALALSLVDSGRADAYVGNAATVSYLIKRMGGYRNLFYGGRTEYSSDHSIGITKNNPILTSIMIKALDSIDQQTRNKISERWFGMRVSPSVPIKVIITLAAISGLLLAIAAYWIFTLRRTRKALRRSEQQIRIQADYDTLTRLVNRRRFYELLTESIIQADEAGTTFGLLFLDLDQFKEVNDTLGHYIGDSLLQRAAKRIQTCVDAGDIVARLGGDEFTIIIPDVKSRDDLNGVANRVCEAMSAEFLIQNHSIYVSSSVGITLYPEDAKTADELLINADQAMYDSKAGGRNRYSFFDESMRQALIVKNQMLKDLRYAITDNQFELFYQPIVDLKSGKIHKAEALIRWNHPSRGLISPADFIPLTEESGQILEMGEWIFKEAATKASQWRRQFSPDLQISINTSPLQYRDNGINVSLWVQYLHQLGTDGSAIIVEITEGLLMDSSKLVKDKLLELRDFGIEVAIDDFGTGYSSLSYLKRFHIDCLKIDQSFVANLAQDSEDLALCEAIIMMSHKLGCKVIAEGIETKPQRDLLEQIGCDSGQGYYFSKPVPAALFEKLLIEDSVLDDSAPTLRVIPAS